ncbi:hypothetical protein GOQ29_05750, partial [Clostridium sp. D2Q-14]|uniref:hypothetical protein n=1 Tax=Anaeromonas gelatinilytica TaxID=2683194 RepID=UPI00193AF2ED
GPVSYFIAVAYNWFPLLIGPILLALITSHSVTREKKGKISDLHHSMGINPQKSWLSKIIVNSLDLSIIYLINLIIALCLETFLYGNTGRIGQIILTGISLIIVNIALIPFSMFISSVSNQFITIMANFLLTFIAVYPIAVSDYWFSFPWAYSLRIVAALLGIHPNGTFLPSHSPLLDSSVVPVSLILSIVIFLITTYLTQFYYNRKVTSQ